MFKRIISLFVLYVFSLLFTSAHAALMEYSYVGQEFTTVTKEGTPRVEFDITQRITGSFIAEEFTVGFNELFPVESFAFSAGGMSITSSEATQELVQFQIAADGTITSGLFFVSYRDDDWLNGIIGSGEHTSILIGNGTRDSVSYQLCENLARGSITCNNRTATNASAFVETAGSWTVRAVPEPSIIALFTAGLVGIWFARRRQS